MTTNWNWLQRTGNDMDGGMVPAPVFAGQKLVVVGAAAAWGGRPLSPALFPRPGLRAHPCTGFNYPGIRWPGASQPHPFGLMLRFYRTDAADSRSTP